MLRTTTCFVTIVLVSFSNRVVFGVDDVTVRFSASDYGTLNETENSYITVTIERIGRTSSSFHVTIEVDRQVNDFKFRLTSWPVYFGPSQSERLTQSREIFVRDDDDPEDDETYTFYLRVPKYRFPVSVTEPSTATITIPANDDADGIVSIQEESPLEVIEVAGKNQSINVKLLRERGTFGNVTVSYEISRSVQSDEQPTEDPSYVDDIFPASGLIVIEDGQNSAVLELFVNDDKIPENDEVFVLSLSSIDKGRLDDENHSVEIIVRANDSPLRFLQSSKRVTEEDGHANVVHVYVLRGMDDAGGGRIGPDSGEVFVNYRVVPGTASSTFDYSLADFGTLRFGSGVHNESLEVFIVPDLEAEVAENFTILLLPSTVVGDAVVTSPDTCIVTIETNDEANGVLSIDFSDAVRNERDEHEVFVFDEDDLEKVSAIRILRRGGTFENVSIDWTLELVSESNPEKITPTSGTVTFQSGQTEDTIQFFLKEDDIPQEATEYVLKLMPDTVRGGAKLEGQTETKIYISDSDDVYGIVNIQRRSTIEVDHETDKRTIHMVIERSGGSVGKIDVAYSAFYLPPDAVDVRDAMPGILNQPTGNIILENGVGTKDVFLDVKDAAFLQTDSSFQIRLDDVQLADREPLVPTVTPRFGARSSAILPVSEEFANSEVGFADPSELIVSEPEDEGDPLEIVLEITREGLSSATTVEISYRNDVEISKQITRDVDYTPGPTRVIFAPGQRTATISLKILPDDEPETDEVLLIKMDGVKPENQKLNKKASEKRIVVRENDSPGGIFQFDTNSTDFFHIQEDESETIALTIFRTEGDLVRRMVKYDIYPNGSDQFVGVPEILLFEPGQRSINIALVPREDGIPELAENFTLNLETLGSPASTIGHPSSVRILVDASDDPHGVFVIAEEDSDKNIPGREQGILESTLISNYSCFYVVRREKGSYGDVTVGWKLIPGDTNDIFPTQGVLVFDEGVTEAIIDLWSLPDELPESMEEFSILLHNATRGSRVGYPNNASLIIDANDESISFEGPATVFVEEGQDLVLNVRRDGTGSDATTIFYKTRSREDNDGQSHSNEDGYLMLQAVAGEDYVSVPDSSVPRSGTIHFSLTSLDETVRIFIPDDEIPEDDEEFFVEIFNPTGDYVAYGNTKVQVKILHNDNSSGVFYLAPPRSINIQEGLPFNLSIQRDFGTYRAVDVHWRIVSSNAFSAELDVSGIISQSEEVDDFINFEGVVEFSDNEASATFVVEARKDEIPEYKEDFILLLSNISGGSASLSSDINVLLVNLSIEMNDYPHGKMVIAESSRDVNVSEDVVEQGEESSTDVYSAHLDITIERAMGADGVVKVIWELYNIAQPLPECQDLFLPSHLNGVSLGSRSHRPPTETPIYELRQGSYAKLDMEEQKIHINASVGFGVSLWMLPNLEEMFDRTDTADASDVMEIFVPLLAKYDKDIMIFSMGLNILGSSYEDIQLTEFVFAYGIDSEHEQQLSFVLGDIFKVEREWIHFVINVSPGGVSLFLNGELKSSRSTTVALQALTDGPIYLGTTDPRGLDATFHGLMQDFRMYERPLENEEIEQIYQLPAKSDVTPVSGYLEYGQGEGSKIVTIKAVDDTLTEWNEQFYLVILDTNNGAYVGKEEHVASITVLKSDNANGLFGFFRSCQPQEIEEGRSATCFINRTLGTHKSVTVNWKIEPKSGNGRNRIEHDDNDFKNKQGSVIFAPGQTEASFTIEANDDQVPEISESHEVILESVISHDGVISSTSTSGASIDRGHGSTEVRIKKGDRAHGVLQFSSGPVPRAPSQNQSSIALGPLIVHVEEEQHDVSLLVVRAAGWHGDVTVEWRTRDGTAISSKSPRDFVSAAGTLSFRDGEGFKFVNVTLLDDEEPELSKSFFVDLLTPTGGAEVNGASHAEIIIAPSDNAYGVYQFSPDSLAVTGQEPYEGINTTYLQVKRTGGNLGRTTLKWRVRSDPDGDLDRNNGEIIFEFGQRVAEIEISVLADDQPEFDEHFIVELFEVSHGVLGGAGSLVALITVPANDDPYGVVSFQPGTVTVEEGAENATLTVIRTGGTSGAIRIHFKTADADSEDVALKGIAVSGRDFAAQDSTFLMKENVTVGTFTIPILDDDIPETDEDFFVQLTFVELMPANSVPNSPRLGTPQETIIRVVINENDSPRGIIELSSSSVMVNEEWSDDDKSVVEIVRKFGTFGEITVGVTTIQDSALPDEDYSLSSTEVTFLEGEDRKPFPVQIINDFTPEFDEYFSLQLIKGSVTGGAKVGEESLCRVLIEKSDYPYGSLEISVIQSVVSEPLDESFGVPVEFTVKRRGGLSGVVAVEWKAFIDSQNDWSGDGSADYDGLVSGEEPIVDDIDITTGVINMVSNQTEAKFTIKVMPDDIPENDEIVKIKLERIMPTYRGVINRAKDTAILRIPANDFPYGTVSLEHASYTVEEGNSSTNLRLKVVRSAGLFGMLRVVYSTEEIDLITEALERNEDIITGYFETAVPIPPQVATQQKHTIDVTSQSEPLLVCAEACMRQRTCTGFVYSDVAAECAWIQASEKKTEETATRIHERLLTAPAARFMYYMKNKRKSDILYDSQARSGMDFEPITGASLLLRDGQDSGDIVIRTLNDDTPELDEFFKVRILNVSVLRVDSSTINLPVVIGNKESTVTIGENDHPYGVFTLYSAAAGSKDNGRTIEAEEKPQLSLEMIVERKGGSVGEVTVDWRVLSGEALRNVDFVGDDATLKFGHGDVRKVISLSVIDDDEPELNEDINVELSDPSGGAVVSDTEGKVEVTILANDNVGGIVSFHPQSRAVIGDEGDNIRLDLMRSSPAKGSCNVTWDIQGANFAAGINVTRGVAHFPPDVTTTSIWLQLIADDTPEIKEEYNVRLTGVKSFGIPITGSAAIDPQGSVAEISIRGSDEPHGVFRFSEMSQIADATESMGKLELFVARGFGSIGKVKVFFEIIPGTLSTLNPDIEVAQPFVDFTFTSDGVENGRHYILFENGVTSVPIVFHIVDDDVPELNEIFLVNLTDATLVERSLEAINFIPPSIDAVHSLSQIVIDANDGTKGMISFHADSVNVTANEIQGRDVEITLTIVREKGTYGEVTFFIFPQNREAELGEDYSCEAKTMTIADSQDKVFYTIAITDDDIPEGEESFEVVLGNPSAGLELGNVTKSTIYILSNDDAHGRLSFTNEVTLFVDEPDNESILNSKAELVITRNPPKGTFGDISVKYHVDRASSPNQDRGPVSNDIFPTEGYITIKDGVLNEVLEISALSDDEAELDEKFIVTLSHPQGGATLSDDVTTQIVIRENDAPYGRFKIVPKGRRFEGPFVDIEEGPGPKVLAFEVTREQGALGSIRLAVKTKNGSAYPVSYDFKRLPMLGAVQTFDASSMTSFHSFVIGRNQFLLALSSDRSGPLTTPIGSSGTLSTLTPGVHTTLLVFKGAYVPVQTVETDGASAAVSFTSQGKTYLFISNHGKYGRYETVSRLYKVAQDGRLNVMDEVPSKGATDVTHYESDGKNYLVIANSVDNNQISSIDSYVYRFDHDDENLDLIQTLPTRGASSVRTFTWKDNVYLAIANRRDTELRNDATIPSVIYKWTNGPDGVPSFTNRKTVDVSHATAVEIVKSSHSTFVILSSASFAADKVKSQTTDRVDIFKVASGQNGNSVVLQNYQTLNISNTMGIRSAKVPSSTLPDISEFQTRDEDVHLLSVSSSTGSSLYWLNPESETFEILSTTGPTKTLLPIPTYSRYRNTTLMAVAVDDISSSQSNAKDILNTIVKSGIYYLSEFSDEDNEGNDDFMPVMNDLVLEFAPGKTTHSLALTLLDDDIPENEEFFTIFLDNSIDRRADIDEEFGSLEVRILSNDDAHGVIGFSEDSLMKTVEETEKDNTFTLNLVRLKATFGEITIEWKAEGSLADISPLQGQVTFADGQTKAGIQITILSDDTPEVEETVLIILSRVVHGGNDRSHFGARINSSSSTAELKILPNDSPHGIVRWSASSLRTAIKEPETLSGATQLVTLEIRREQGQLGAIQVFYETQLAANLPEKSQAMPGVDYIARDGSISMSENVTSATVAISIVPDDIPEDIESFYVLLAEVKMIGESMLDSKPGIGPPGADVAEIIIDENDHARGFIQFNVTRNSKDVVDAFEMPGVNTSIKLPLVRLVGLFRSVGVEWLAKPMTAATSDFYPHAGSVHFEEGQRNSFIEIFIVDDNDVEFVETFTVQLIGKSGGVKLGGDVAVTVNILPNDSPSGMFGFLQTSEYVKESKTAKDPEGKVEFDVKRFQGSSDDVIVSWSLGEEAFGDLTPISGTLRFGIGERVKTIVIRSLPDQELEGEEIFDIRLTSATGGAEISPIAGVAKVTIEADEGAAGTVSIDLSTADILTGEPTELYDGISLLTLHRGPGYFGECIVQWQITPADGNAFEQTEGEAKFEDMENETNIVIQTVDDEIPEMSQDFALRLISATAGATIDGEANSAKIAVAASDSPHGTFSFSQPSYYVKEDGGSITGPASTIYTGEITTTPIGATSIMPRYGSSSTASLTLLRNDGHIGEVSVVVVTSDGSATENEDYYGFSRRLVFGNGESFKVIEVELLNDDIPEGPEEFYVNITDVTLLSHLDNGYKTYGVNNDMRPKLGDASFAIIQIIKNDGAEGIVEFPADLDEIIVDESNGSVLIPLVRLRGNYGEVSVNVETADKTAERNVDYLAPAAGINAVFEDGQTKAFLSVTIVDDSEMEMDEAFTVFLSGVNGGAKLGEHLIAQVTIKKSDYPNGRLHILEGDDAVRVRNPPADGEGNKMNFVVERSGGNIGEVTAKWKVIRTTPYYGETTSATPVSEDIGAPSSGTFHFNDGEGGQREILITILPTSDEAEVEEHFAIILLDTEPAEVSDSEGNMTIIVEKKGNPNGILKFSGEADRFVRPTVLREPESGSLQVVFPVSREEGTLGEVTLKWSAEAVNEDIGADPTADLKENHGEVIFRDGQSGAEVVLYVEADDVPELAEKFAVRLTGVDGGAELDRDSSRREFLVQPNDDPHGVVSIHPSDQSVVVLPDSSRAISVNITRQKGLFGRIAASFTVEFNNPEGDSSYLESDTGDVYMADGSAWAIAQVPILQSAFLAVGDTFTIRITTVEFMDNDVTIPPRLSDEIQASAAVPPEAGNPQVGFDPVVSTVFNTTRNSCRMTLKRVGLYGDVTVRWVSGYPDEKRSTDFREGQSLPASDSVTMSDKQSQLNATLTLFPNSVEAETFAAHILKVTSSTEGGATILENHKVTEIEPCGVVRFATFDQHVTVREDSSEVTLTIQRMYGSRYEIDVSYSTTPITAVPGRDFFPVTNGRVKLLNGQQEATISVTLIKDTVPEISKDFLVTITDVTETLDMYKGLSPRILQDEAISTVTIRESDDAHGVLKFGQSEISIDEQSTDGSNIVVVMVTIQRTVGTFGEVSVVMSTIGGGEPWENEHFKGDKADDDKSDILDKLAIGSYLLAHHERRALTRKDYEQRQINVTFKEMQTQAQVPVVILDDGEPEPRESFFVFLHSPTGGAKVGKTDPNHPGRIMKISIPSNDYPNGNVGFASRDGVVIYEDTLSRSLDLVVNRKAAFGNITIRWRVMSDYASGKEGSSNAEERVRLADQLERTRGEITCAKDVLQCVITITLKDDDVAEFETWFLIELFSVSEGAKIDERRRFLNVTMAKSDYPHGLFQFSLQSRLPVVSKGNKAVGLTVERVGGHKFESSVYFTTRQLRSVSNVAGTMLYPAIEDVDYVKMKSHVTFKPGQEEAFINIPLHPETSSPNPLPQVFQVKLSNVVGDGGLNRDYDTANVTIVGKENTKRVWRVYEALQQNLDDAVVQSVVAQLHSLADEPMDEEQVNIFHGILRNIIVHARRTRLPPHLQDTIYELICKLLDPYRSDALRGYAEFGETFEQFTFSLMTGMECRNDDSVTTTFDKCSLAKIQSARWYPEVINGHKFVGKASDDFFEIPVDLLDVQATGVESPNPRCYDIAFIEYSSQVWFSSPGEKGAMSNKIFSVALDGEIMSNLVNPVRYRIHTNDARISPKGSECVLWNEASKRWLSRSETCSVEYDTDNYVDCICRHMSVYAVRGPTDDLAGYNEATYVACFICAVAAAVIILGHHVCSRHTTFASKLLMHTIFACGLTQLFFVVSTLASEEASSESCAAIAIFLHFFWVAQFTWMLVQAINIWKVLVMSNDNTGQVFTVYFIVGWGLPAVIVALHSIIMYAIGFGTLPEIYGDVHVNGDLCFIMDAKAGLLSAVVPACLAIMATCTIGLQLYQRDHAWKQYDDLFRGRFNETEIPLLFWFFFLLAFSWLWGGLHLGYGQMWMLVLFILFDMIQGLYLLLVYGILHNQIVKPIKTPYETGDGATATTVYATSAAGSRAPSVAGDLMNRSTQNLVGKGKDDFDLGLVEPHFPRSNPLPGGNIDDTADFDDLMFALKTEGVGERDSPRDRIVSLHSSPVRHSAPQGSLRVIDDPDDDEIRSTHSSPRRDPGAYPIADTHL